MKIDRIVGVLGSAEDYVVGGLGGIKFSKRFQTAWSGVCKLTQIICRPTADEIGDVEFLEWREEMTNKVGKISNKQKGK